MKTPRIFAIVVLAALLSGQANELGPLEDAFDRSSIVISSSRYACYSFDIYLAYTDRQRARGLMFVRSMPERHGMLFVYDDAGLLSMWMKNTFIPLDMLFIRRDGTIANIATDTEPQSLRSVRAVEPVNYVLELNAGVTAKLGIDTESIVFLPSDL